MGDHMNFLKYIENKLKLKKFWQDESAQGMTEYILLLVVVVTLAYIFKDKIKKAVAGKMDSVGSGIDDFKIETN
jgi:Flp pilus assembly pilin Flp